MTALTRPAVPVVAVRTDGVHVNSVTVKCLWCGSTHTHPWFDETEGFSYPPCRGGGAAYRITIDTGVRLKAVRENFAVPDGVVGLVPLAISFAYELDPPDEDVIGIVVSTALGRFAIWLPMPAAIGVADAIVDIAEDREGLRADYLEAQKTAT
jgi:hypothetical protein